MKFYDCLKILPSKGVKFRNLDFKTFNLLFGRLFSNSLLSCCNRVRQIYVSRRSTHEILYRRRKLGHKISCGYTTNNKKKYLKFNLSCAVCLCATSLSPCSYSFHFILVPRDRDPFDQHQESRPVAAPNTESPRFTDSLSNLTNLIG